MNQTAQGTGATAAFTRVASLAHHTHLAPRVQSLIHGLLVRAGMHFEVALTSTLNVLEQELFTLAERARNNDSQQDLFEALRTLKQSRSNAVPRFLHHLESALAVPPPEAASQRPALTPRAAARVELELVDSHTFEEDLLLQEIARKGDMRHGSALQLLGWRLAALHARAPFDLTLLPLGPDCLVAALRQAMEGTGIGLEQRMLAYRVFDRVAMAPLAPFYEVVNAWLVEQRVLPNLRPLIPVRPAESGASARAGEHDPGEHGAEPVAAEDPPPSQSPAYEARHPAAMVDDAALFEALRGLLAGRRDPSPPPAGACLASRSELQSVLGALQRAPIQPNYRGTTAPRSARHLKQDLLAQLHQAAPEGRAPVLADEDSDTVDLVGMLFEHIGSTAQPQSILQELLAKLQMPILRVALGDKGFFTQRNHAARQLLNTIAEASVRWLDDEPDPDLTARVHSIVDRLGAEYDGNSEVIQELATDFTGHMDLLARRAEAAERRHVEAAKGREKLDLARDRARAAIARLVRRRPSSALVRTLVEEPWADVLALTILRQGEQSPAFRRRLAVADELLRHGQASGVPLSETVREELGNGLAQIGMHEAEVSTLVRTLDAPVAVGDDEPTIAVEGLHARQRLGGPVASELAKPDPADRPEPLTAPEQEMLERLRGLPFGTWFEFVTNQQGEMVRRKLAWFSPVTGNCLFVNQRGARAEERTMDQVARALACGQMRVIEAQGDSLIDRAWKSIMDTLRQLSGGDRTAAAGA